MTRFSVFGLVAIVSTSCGSEVPAPDELERRDTCFGANPEVALAHSEDFSEVWARVVSTAEQMDAPKFVECHAAVEGLSEVTYDPLAATHLDLVDEALELQPEQEDLLAQNGFVVLENHDLETFEEAYASLYQQDLPVFVSSDSLLYALHRSFDRILLAIEGAVLEPELDLFLEGMHSRLATLQLPASLESAATDLDVYLTVARTLLLERYIPTVRGEGDEKVAVILADIAAGEPNELELFGVESEFDYSQLQPRGHYTEGLEAYFRSTMWLGRTEMPLYLFEPAAQFNRRGVEAAVLSGILLEGEPREHWDRVERVLRQLLGEPDSMSPRTLDAYREDAGLVDIDALASATDSALETVLLEHEYGVQRIMSQILFSNPSDPTFELPRVYLLLGQRFSVDSHILHSVVYDRLVDPDDGMKTTRMLPRDLDVAFALGSNLAGELLQDEIEAYDYQFVLHELRFLVDSHPEAFWNESFYNGWLHALRSLDDADEQAELPEAMRTKAWGYKTLTTQLASWAELRHDTILYTKPSYTSALGCEYPDAYVEPVPMFYSRMRSVADQGLNLATTLEDDGYELPELRGYFEHMSEVMIRLESIAAKELEGVPLDDDEWQFLRATIEEEKIGCAGDLRHDGWFGKLLYEAEDHGDFRPTIADIHTVPTDEFGVEVGWVLHAGTGRARWLVLTVEDCAGARAYVGPVSSYFSTRTDDYERLDDDAWRTILHDDPPPPPGWNDAFAR